MKKEKENGLKKKIKGKVNPKRTGENMCCKSKRNISIKDGV